jgi:hypothetical protein
MEEIGVPIQGSKELQLEIRKEFEFKIQTKPH